MNGKVELPIDEYNALMDSRKELVETRKGHMYKIVYIGVTNDADKSKPFFVNDAERRVYINKANEVALHKLQISLLANKRLSSKLIKLKSRGLIKRIFNTD